ncbi:MAG: anti-sigma factor (TIGR02949 family) [Nitriliruptoraceae bacterium]|jgi:anti-sigma factor (TIGR02949 family)
MNPLNEPSPEAPVNDGCAPALDGGADCSELFAKLDLLLDRELPLHELDQLEVHLAACLPCAGRRDFESQLRAVVRSRCADQAPAALVEKIRAKLELPDHPVS